MHKITFPDLETTCVVSHDRWIKSMQAAGATSEVLDDTKEELMMPYGQLSETAKELVRVQVKSVFSAIEHHGVPSTSEIDHIAETAHARWIEGRKASGAASEKLDYNSEEQMVPFDQLSPTTRDLTRNSIRAVLDLIERNTQQLAAG